MTDQVNEAVANLYHAVNAMLLVVGRDGEIDSRHESTAAVMQALRAIDGGQYNPELQIQATRPSRGVVDVEAAHDDTITLSDVSGVLGEIAAQFDGGEYHVGEEVRSILIDFAHGITDHPLFSIVGHHFVQRQPAWLIEHRNCGWWQGYQGLVGGDVWTRDANRAIRFYSKLDAERAIGVLGLPAASVFASEVRAAALPAVPDGPEWWRPDARVIELAHRLVASGPKAAHVSASETHEISEFILSLTAATPAHDQPEGSDNG